MKKFKNILFASRGTVDETQALKQALSLALINGASLNALIVCPDLPKEMADYKDRYEESLAEQLKASIKAARAELEMADADLDVKVEVESGNTPGIRIIQKVIKQGYDLVVKQTEPQDEGKKGYTAVDMELLRKCPCPVWLSRPIARQNDQIRVAVAIDPEAMASEGHDLSLRLLELSRALADICDGELKIISCWDYEFEASLRNNIWIKKNEDEIAAIVSEAKESHLGSLNAVIKESGVEGKIQIDHIRGKPDQIIPHQVKEKEIDILIMGTVARTGIQGFIIGNTAENIVQKLECSLVALKPYGFVSPVKAYP